MAAGAATSANAAIQSETLLENEQVRVTRVSVPPGGSMQPHDGGQRAIYALADNDINWRPYGAAAERKRWPAGTVHFHDAGRHSLANVGSTPAEFVVFERLTAPLPTAATNQGKDTTASTPEQGTLMSENPSFRVMQITLKPGEAQPVHDGSARVVYSLTDYEIEWQEGDAAPEPRQWRAGQAHWHAPGKHAARNIGKTDARWLIVALKD
jgi:quercetin dioxygenase-like cupin family protein